MTKREELRKWAEDVVPEFNKLSDATKTPYYTQSPLNVIEWTIENLVIGIDPGSGGHEACILDVADFFTGNKEWWDNRFVSTENGAEITKGGKYKYFNNGHYIICGDRIRHNDGFDNDAKTVWTNFTPFSTKGKATINNDHYKKSVPKIVELINILSPKRIYLFGKDSFNFFTDYQNCVKIERKKILKDNLEDGILEIGEINGIPAIQLPHPSIKWRFHKIFVPLFAEMWRNCLKEKLPLDELSIKMRKQLTRLVPIED